MGKNWFQQALHTPSQLEQAVGPEVLDTLSKQTGLSREEAPSLNVARAPMRQSRQQHKAWGVQPSCLATPSIADMISDVAV